MFAVKRRLKLNNQEKAKLVAHAGFSNAITKLRKVQYHNRNKKFGDRRTGEKASNKAKKYFKKVARLHRDIANQRKDFLNKTTTGICRKYAHIRIEDLNVSGMIANRKLSQAISDLGFYEFRRQLTTRLKALAVASTSWIVGSRLLECVAIVDRSIQPSSYQTEFLFALVADIQKIETCRLPRTWQMLPMNCAVGSVRPELIRLWTSSSRLPWLKQEFCRRMSEDVH